MNASRRSCRAPGSQPMAARPTEVHLALTGGDLKDYRFGAYSEDTPGSLLGFLFSYWYCKKVDMEELLGPLVPKPPLFADSGAFSAHTLGGEVSVDAYAEWLHRWKHLFGHYANLDVLSDHVQSAKNQRALERKGLTPIPVFHGGEPWRLLKAMVEKYDYVALGGIARFHNKPVLVGWLDECFRIAEGKAGLHGFGMTRWELVRRFPWRSVDSSSIGSGYRYGSVKTYDPYGKRWVSWRVNDRGAWGKHGWLVREYGLTPADFAEARSRECTRALIRLATRSMRKAIDDLPTTQLYIAENKGKQAGLERVHEYGKANMPTELYMADTSLPTTREEDGSMRVDTFNEANGGPGAVRDAGRDPRPRGSRRAGRS